MAWKVRFMSPEDGRTEPRERNLTIGSPEGMANQMSASSASFWPFLLLMPLLIETNCLSSAFTVGTTLSTFSLTMNETFPPPGTETRFWKSCLGSRADEKAISKP